MNLLICGDREWTNRRLIRDHIVRLQPDCVIHGAARGADKIAGEEATDLQIEFIASFPAKWLKEKKAAGPIRNSRMLKNKWNIVPDYALAFHNNIEESRGTADMVKKLKAAGIPVEVMKE
jgi:hypothetical protein